MLKLRSKITFLDLLFFAAFSILLIFSSYAKADIYEDVEKMLQLGKLMQAQQQAIKYLKNKPNDPQMRFLLSSVQLAQGNTKDAIENLTRLTQSFPEIPEPYNNLAVIYARENQYEQARSSLEMAVRLNPKYTTALENLGDIYAKLAIQSYTRSLNSSNKSKSKKLTQIQNKVQAMQELLSINSNN